MRLTTVILLVSLLQVSASTFGQRITINQKNAALESVLKEIRKQIGYGYYYGNDVIPEKQKINIAVTNASLEEALSTALQGLELRFEIEDKVIVIKKKEPSFLDRIVDRFAAIDVRGRVVDSESGEGLAGATVKVKGTNKQTSTNGNGEFFIHNVDENAILLIRFIGYETIESKAKEEMGNVKMKLESAELEEIKINGGYYSTTERARTGNISKVKGIDIERQPVTSPLMALQGRVAGLDIRPVTGAPGSAVKINIRGQNSLRVDGSMPLYVVDGVPVDSKELLSSSQFAVGTGFDPLATIDPANIESIEVLKDADATSIYGSRGANGVILITTKRGMNSGSNFTAATYTGVGSVPRYLDMLNTQQYIAMRREAFKNDNLEPTWMDSDINGDWDTTRYTDWQRELLGENANITDTRIGTSGGSATTRYNVFVGYHNENTVYPGDFGFKRLSGNFGFDHNSTDKRFIVSFSNIYGLSKSKMFNSGGFLGAALFLPPNAPALYNDNGELNWPVSYPFGPSFAYYNFDNPLAELEKTHEAKQSLLESSLSIGYEILTALRLRVRFGFTDLRGEDVAKEPISARAPGNISSFTTGLGIFGANKRQTWIAEPQIDYNRRFGNHGINIIAGGTVQGVSSDYQSIIGNGYTSDALLNSIVGAPEKYYTLRQGAYRYISGFARLGYDFDNKVFVNLTGRRDGSSRFGPQNRFSNFGSVGAAWIFSESEFFRHHFSFISRAKIRSSYGTSGSDQIGDFEYLKTFSLTSYPYLNTLGLVPSALHTPDIQWEATRKAEVALEFGFMKDRILTDVSWYKNTTSNQLINYDLSSVTGFVSVRSNFPATVQNTGIELNMQGEIIRKGFFQWKSSFNVSFPRNKLVAFPGIENTAYSTSFKVGEAISTRYIYKWNGIDPVTGRHTIADINSDGIINDNDRSFLLNSGTKYQGGLFNNLVYRNIEFSFLIQISESVNDIVIIGGLPGTGKNNKGLGVLDRWQKLGDVETNPAFSTQPYDDYERAKVSDFAYKKIRFARLKTLSLSYQIPANVLSSISAKSANIFLQAQNLLTLSNFTDNLDPETGNALPPLRMINVGLQLTF